MVLLLLVGAPLLVVLFGWRVAADELWQHLWRTGLLLTIGRSMWLAVAVASLATLLGVALALAVTLFEFRGRRWLQWLLPLPLAVPSYVLAFIYIGLAESAAGIVLVPGFREHWGLFAVMILALYPYAYLLALGTLSVGGVAEQFEVARTLGVRFWSALCRILLPALRPAISGALAIIALEVLADFGAVATFNYDTLTTAVVTTWQGFFNLPAAMQLASLLLLLAALVVLFEHRGRALLDRSAGQLSPLRQQLAPGPALALGLGVLAAPLFGLLLPLAQLLFWGLPHLPDALLEWRAAGNTLLLGVAAALPIVALGALLATGVHRAPTRLLRFGARTVLTGYAIPGIVMAIGLLSILAPVGLVGSLVGLLAAYTARFCGPVVRLLSAASSRLPMALEDSARTLGVGGVALLGRLWLPALRPALLAAALLVCIEVIKEMPMTLMLRAPGWDTLAVRLYALTSEGEWERAAAPGLLLIVLCLLPVWLMRWVNR